MPALICRKCQKHVVQASDFRKLVLKAEESFKGKLTDQHYVFHENLRELKEKLKSEAKLAEEAVILEKPTTSSAPVTMPAVSLKEPEKKKTVEPATNLKEPEAAVEESLSSMNDSFNKLNEVDMEDFWKEANEILIDVLDGLEDVEMGEKGSKTTVPVTKRKRGRQTKKTGKKTGTEKSLKEQKPETRKSSSLKEHNIETEKVSNPKAQKPETEKIPNPKEQKPETEKVSDPEAQKIETEKVSDENSQIETVKTPVQFDVIEVSDDDDNDKSHKDETNFDIFNNMTMEQIMEMTALISSVLPPDPEEKPKRKRKKKEPYTGTITIDLKKSKIIKPATSTPVPIKKRRDSILNLPKIRKVKTLIRQVEEVQNLNSKKKTKSPQVSQLTVKNVKLLANSFLSK